MRLLSLLARVFGLFWLVFGANGLFHFFPVPAPSADAAYYMEALTKTGYMLPLLYGIELTAGLMLVLGAFVPLALLLLAPITLQIVLYDLVLNPSGLVIGIAVALIHALLLWKHRAAYRPMLACGCMG